MMITVGVLTLQSRVPVAATEGNNLADILSTVGFNYDEALAQKLFFKAIETELTNESIMSRIRKTFAEKPQ